MGECAWSVGRNVLGGRNGSILGKICLSDILSTVILTWIRPKLNTKLRDEMLTITPPETSEGVMDC